MHDWKKKSIEADPELMQRSDVLLNLKDLTLYFLPKVLWF